MGKLYKGTVDLWINVPEGCEVAPAELIDRLAFALAQAASVLGVGLFPENAKDVAPATIEEWAEVARAEAAQVIKDPGNAEVFNALIDQGVTLVNARQQTTADATV